MHWTKNIVVESNPFIRLRLLLEGVQNYYLVVVHWLEIFAVVQYPQPFFVFACTQNSLLNFKCHERKIFSHLKVFIRLAF